MGQDFSKFKIYSHNNQDKLTNLKCISRTIGWSTLDMNIWFGPKPLFDAQINYRTAS
jgi:hypothetical protein